MRELLALVRSYYPQPRAAQEVIACTGLHACLDSPYARLSGGQQRRVQFALAICGDPQLLFLDEPTTGLDIEARESLWAVVRDVTARGCAILLTTHYLEEAEALAQRVAVLSRGRVVDPQLAVEAWSEADPLNERERQVLRLAGEGLSLADIAAQLSLSHGTVPNYLSEAIGKLNAANRIEAYRLARQKGWL